MDSSAWVITLVAQLEETFGKTETQRILSRYQHAFHTSYQEEVSPALVMTDIQQMEKLSPERNVDINFYFEDNVLHLRLFEYNQQLPLSDVIPLLENMDLRTLAEKPYQVTLDDAMIWISDFSVVYGRSGQVDFEAIETNFQECIIRTLLNLSENDGFNKLIIGAQLSWREITILRAYAKYLKQTGFRFSQAYIEASLVNNIGITKNLVAYFNDKFDPNGSGSKLADIQANIHKELESVTSLDEDKILRALLLLMQATLRTNYFQTQVNGDYKAYLSFKINSKALPELPQPVPLFEIFVYAPHFEGIHLRNAKVARGGIRWSDRPEDFRTEILGLMKAQKVKNAVIVPSGAKGGFVLKSIPPLATRDVIQKEVVTCYKLFICGLLDLTDNIIDQQVIHPAKVVRYDEDDTYLVVAADKGTAAFSDIANGIALDYQFWLGDAFASGGSEGYDHKKMGITARGAWESVKRHFWELELDYLSTDFTCVGIGDMSGDVFGNGLLYSPHTLLVAAFDHRHIFIDPNPNGVTSFNERQRLFQLPNSSWSDYDAKLISAGGGVYQRNLKSIPISPDAQRVLNITESSLAPTDLIRAILKAPVDLLWNGGVGTYVKASTESNMDVGDRTNDYCRINGAELQCRVVGEGGNLGFTQLGRVEYALKGGLINTDFIDNSAGVDCSDHEVNIKILLNQEMAKEKLTETDRHNLLVSMTDEIATLVLKDNYNQALVLSIANYSSSFLFNLQIKYIQELDSTDVLNRTIEYLPDDKKLIERKASGQGLTRPELAILLAYTKINIKKAILDSSIPEDTFIKGILNTAFPPSLVKQYGPELAEHPLHREIVATQLSNLIVNEVGTLFIYNLQNETGLPVSEIFLTAVVSIHIYNTTQLQANILTLGYKLPIASQYDLISHIRRLIYLSTRWFLRHKRIKPDNIQAIIQDFSAGIAELQPVIPELMGGSTKQYLDKLVADFAGFGIAADVAAPIAGIRAMYTALNIIEIQRQHHFALKKIAKTYFAVGEHFNLLWFRDQLANDSREGFWEGLARLTLRDELDLLQRDLTVMVLNECNEPQVEHCIQAWTNRNHEALQRWHKMLEMLHSSPSSDYVMFFIALRELGKIIHHREVVS